MHDRSTSDAAPQALIWGVKTSFRRYLRTAGGTVTVTPPASEDGFFFVFPLDTEQAAAADDIAANFVGSVHFAAHFGALDFSLSDPAITQYGGASWLTVAAAPTSDIRRITIALLTHGPQQQAANDDQGTAQLELWPMLTAEGSHLFGDVYPTETLLDPLYVPRSLADRMTP